MEVPSHAVIIHRPTGQIAGPPTPLFKKDWPFSIPTPETKVWRYMEFKKLEDWLNNKAIRFARCDTFNANDSLDGRYTDGNRQRLSKTEAAFQAVYAIKDSFDERIAGNEITRGCTFISCWNIATNEQARMWKEYTRTTNAVAVVSSVGTLQRFLPESINISRVKYVDDDFPRSRLTVHSVYFFKSRQFSHENELRLLRPLGLDESVDRDDPEDRARHVRVRLRKVIHEVVVHPDADFEKYREIQTWLAKVLPGIRARPSSLPRQGLHESDQTASQGKQVP